MVKKLHVDLAARNVALIEHRTAFSAAHPPLPSGWCRALESFGVDVSKSPNQMCRGVANPVDHVSVAQHGEVDSRYALVCWTLPPEQRRKARCFAGLHSTGRRRP